MHRRDPAQHGYPELLDILRQDWSWILPGPQRIISVSAFGNVLVECADRSLWRVCPEDLTATRVADSAAHIDRLFADPGFRDDWEVTAWVREAESQLGALAEGQCYGFRIWPVLNGAYSPDNMVIKTLREWLSASGDVGRQLKDLPDGTTINLDIE